MIYKFRLLSGEVEDFIREIEIRSDQLFSDLHYAIQDSVGYDKSQMTSFFLSNDEWERGTEITLFEMTEDDENEKIVMDVALLSEFVTTAKQKIIYLFDFFSERVFFIELVMAKKVNPEITYPICVRSEGEPPQQIVLETGNVDLYQEDIDNDDEGFDDGMSFENLDDFNDI